MGEHDPVEEFERYLTSLIRFKSELCREKGHNLSDEQEEAFQSRMLIYFHGICHEKVLGFSRVRRPRYSFADCRKDVLKAVHSHFRGLEIDKKD